MFLTLEPPKGDKYVSLYAHNLKGEARWDVVSYTPWDSERSKFDAAVLELNREMDPRKWKLFPGLFNQFRWRGTSGWEYWSKEYERILSRWPNASRLACTSPWASGISCCRPRKRADWQLN